MEIGCFNPACEQRLRMPDGVRGLLNVRCPSCNTRFRWSAPGSKLEVFEMPVRCAVTGLKSRAVLGRDRPTDDFRLRMVNGDGRSVVSEERKRRAANSEPSMARTAPAANAVGTSSDRKGWRKLDWWLGSKRSSSATATEQAAAAGNCEATPRGESENGGRGTEINSEEIDMTGWHCPHCQHPDDPGRQDDDTITVRCNACGEMVCAGRVIRVSNGVRTFRCHDGCGGTGELGNCPPFSVSGEVVAQEGTPSRSGAIGVELRRALFAPRRDGSA